MLRGLYASASGMLVEFFRQSILSANMANVNSVGFKQDVMPTRESTEVAIPGSFANVLNSVSSQATVGGTIGQVGGGVIADPVVPDLSEGKLQQTGRASDLALQGPGFFSVAGPNGQTLYTRAGNFSRQADGSLVTSDGFRLLGQNGPVSLPVQGALNVDASGVVYVAGQPLDKLAVMDVPPQALLQPVGNNSFTVTNPNAPITASASTVVEQGALESSNVDLNQTMVDAMSAMRTYETNSKMLTMQDQVLQQTVSDVGRLA